MNQYTIYCGKILSLLWHFQDISSDSEPPPRSILQLPDFKAISNISKRRKKRVLSAMAKIVCNCYDLEWWWIVNQKTALCGTSDGISQPFVLEGAEKFPTTVASLRRFKEENNLDQVNFDFSKKVTNIGKGPEIFKCNRDLILTHIHFLFSNFCYSFL